MIYAKITYNDFREKFNGKSEVSNESSLDITFWSWIQDEDRLMSHLFAPCLSKSYIKKLFN